MVLTSHSDLVNTDSKTGVWLGEFTDPYYEFIDKGYEVTLASPKGGKPPVDPRSQLTENITSSNRRFQKDEKAQKDFEFTNKLEDLHAEDFDAVFFPGGHGPMGDLATDEITAHLVVDFYRQQKPIGAICHGPAALLTAAIEEPELLIDKEVTAFSNAEEKMVGLRDNIPFSLEDRLKTLGAKYTSATIPFTSKVKVSGRLVTGQNPASAEKAAKEVIKLLG
ncbi:Putative intracellular protease/amidase [Salinimicrobium catena]|uniref:Putative intracellular protease/amidase n=2 Tax=Salinimicrobium catena TaxID=390640 RepID=A0A1H5N0M1_9FLAO|nr:Putative intracellular protease/amidase [Salinimicrobium catena]SEE95179.1 Putative intracellular protease/amidase [Salinimicrobium catena]